MELLKCETSDIENTEKYILKNGEKEIGYGYIKGVEINPIEIFIYEMKGQMAMANFYFQSFLKL